MDDDFPMSQDEIDEFLESLDLLSVKGWTYQAAATGRASSSSQRSAPDRSGSSSTRGSGGGATGAGSGGRKAAGLVVAAVVGVAAVGVGVAVIGSNQSDDSTGDEARSTSPADSVSESPSSTSQATTSTTNDQATSTTGPDSTTTTAGTTTVTKPVTTTEASVPPPVGDGRSPQAVALVAVRESLKAFTDPTSPIDSSVFLEDGSTLPRLVDIQQAMQASGARIGGELGEPVVTGVEEGDSRTVVSVNVPHQGLEVLGPGGTDPRAVPGTLQLKVELVLTDQGWRVDHLDPFTSLGAPTP